MTASSSFPPAKFVFGDLTFPAVTGAAVPLRTRGGDRRVNDSGRNIGLEPRDDRYGVFGRISYEITDDIELFAAAAYNQLGLAEYEAMEAFVRYKF